jgi:hypothetical protein
MRLIRILTLTTVSLAFSCGGDKDNNKETGHAEDTDNSEDTGETLSAAEQQARDAYTAFLDGVPEADLTTDENIVVWAQASAPNVFLQALLPSLLIADQISRWQEAGNAGLPDCPVLTGYNEMGEATGTDTSAVGGCTDYTGVEWVGSNSQYMLDASTIVMLNEGFGTATPSTDCEGENDDFGIHSYSEWSGFEGDTYTIRMVSALTSTTHYVDDSCSPVDEGMALDVVMTRKSVTAGKAEEVTWNQEGHTASKTIVATGQMDIETVDEVTNDSICTSEAISGSTHFTTSVQTAAVHYDGATDCSDDSTVTWTLDGEEQGEISGVACSSTANARGLGGLALSMGLLLIARRRD